jgi:hypothetical protein
VDTSFFSPLKCKDVVHQNMASMTWSYITRVLI